MNLPMKMSIAAVLLVGLTGVFVRPASARNVAVAALEFALLGTLVGLFTIAIGVGPQTTADLLFHALLVGALACHRDPCSHQRVRAVSAHGYSSCMATTRAVRSP